MEINFCRRCAKPVRELAPGTYQCEAGHHLYYKPYPAVLALILNDENQVLIAVRGREPGKGMLDLPGGFLDPEETLEHAIVRELNEETGMTDQDYTTPTYLCSAIDHYEYEGEVQPCIAVTFTMRLKIPKELAAQDDVAELRWMHIKDIDIKNVHPGFRGVHKALALITQRLAEK